jgi:hypothetical protein
MLFASAPRARDPSRPAAHPARYTLLRLGAQRFSPVVASVKAMPAPHFGQLWRKEPAGSGRCVSSASAPRDIHCAAVVTRRLPFSPILSGEARFSGGERLAPGL